MLRPGTVETSCPLPIQNKPKVNSCRPSSGSDTSVKGKIVPVIQREINLHLRGFFALCYLWFKNFRASEVKTFLLIKEKRVQPATQWWGRLPRGQHVPTELLSLISPMLGVLKPCWRVPWPAVDLSSGWESPAEHQYKNTLPHSVRGSKKQMKWGKVA